MVRSSANDVPVLVLDFDGTVCIGDAPVWAYADAVIAAIPANAPRRADVVTGIRSRLRALLDGSIDAGVYVDGYAAVAGLAAAHVTSAQLDRAYLTSRRELASGALAVSAPPGLAPFLTGFGGDVERVLVTNAPATGIAETLGMLDLASAIDRVVTDAGKPAGWARILPELLEGRPAERLMSVGDIWRNDLAAAADAGCATVLIDRFGHRAGPASLVAPRFEQLYQGIREWADDPAAFAGEHPPTPDDVATATATGRPTA